MKRGEVAFSPSFLPLSLNSGNKILNFDTQVWIIKVGNSLDFFV
jgi:hypothetical protein